MLRTQDGGRRPWGDLRGQELQLDLGGGVSYPPSDLSTVIRNLLAESSMCSQRLESVPV